MLTKHRAGQVLPPTPYAQLDAPREGFGRGLGLRVRGLGFRAVEGLGFRV